MKGTIGRIAIGAGVLLLIIVLIFSSYAIYIFSAYYRIEDNLTLEIHNKNDTVIKTNGEYTAVSYNVGFGAYSQDFSFFMDGGKESVAKSKDAVKRNLGGAIDLIKNYNPDFLLVQEVDIKATRSYKVNQYEMLNLAFSTYDSVMAVNYDSPYLFYPFNKPHGKSNAGLSTFSKYNIASSVRRSLPISTSFSKFFDLDRCYSVNQMPVENGKNLYIYNVHLSAYGGTPEIRAGQITMLFNDIKGKIDNGDYVICGGDYNHDLTDETQHLPNENSQGDFEWAQPFPFDMAPSGLTFARNYVDKNAPTARNCDITYIKGTTSIFIVDGFFTSDNIQVNSVENVNNEFMYSDHNPVVLKFNLK